MFVPLALCSMPAAVWLSAAPAVILLVLKSDLYSKFDV